MRKIGCSSFLQLLTHKSRYKKLNKLIFWKKFYKNPVNVHILYVY